MAWSGMFSYSLNEGIRNQIEDNRIEKKLSWSFYNKKR